MIPPHSLYKKYQISLAIRHVRKNCLASSLIIVQKKHAPLEICWCFNALAKSNPPSITSQQQKHFRTKREDNNAFLHLKTLCHHCIQQGLCHVCVELYLQSSYGIHTLLLCTTSIYLLPSNNQSFYCSSLSLLLSKVVAPNHT